MHGTTVSSRVCLLLRVCPSPPSGSGFTAEQLVKRGYHIPVGYVLSIKEHGVWGLPVQAVGGTESVESAAVKLYRREMNLPALPQWIRKEAQWREPDGVLQHLFSIDVRANALAFSQRCWERTPLGRGEPSPRKFFNVEALYKLVVSNKFNQAELRKLYELGLLIAFGKEEPGERKRKSLGKLLTA